MQSTGAYIASLADGARETDPAQSGKGEHPAIIRLAGNPRRARSAALAAAVSALVLCQSATGSPGDIDTSFGVGGRADLGNLVRESWALEVLADQSAVLAGGSDNCDYYGNYTCEFAGLAGRVSEAGVRDDSFAAAFLEHTRVHDLAVQSDQKIVGVGMRLNATTNGSDLFVFRMLATGQLDANFAGNGSLVLANPGNDWQEGNSVLVDDQQRIVIAGSRAGNLMLVRLQPDGTLDMTFGTNGVFVGPASYGSASSPRIVASGSGYLAMPAGNSCGVLAVTANGTIDPTYGTGGVANPASPGALCRSFGMQAGGKPVIGGITADGEPAVWRLLPSGAPDSTFDGGSVATVLTDLTALAIAPDGKVLVAGRGPPSESPAAVTRLQANGSLDGAYGKEGAALIEADTDDGGYPSINDMKVLTSGRVLLAGRAFDKGHVVPIVARLLADGEAGPGIITVSERYVSATEAEGQAIVHVRRIGGSKGAVSVAVNTVASESGTPASASSDYTAVSQRLDWADGDATEKQVVVPIIASSTPLEGTEMVDVQLSDAQGGAGLGVRRAQIQIQGDESPAGFFSVQVSPATVTERNTLVTIMVSRHSLGQGPVSVTVNVVGVTATAGKDFMAVSPVTLTWGDGDLSDKVATFEVLSDFKHEPDETIRVELVNPTGGAVLDGAAAPTVTIVDNDKSGGGGGGGAFGALGALLLAMAGVSRRRR